MTDPKLVPVNHSSQDPFTLSAPSGCEIVGQPLISDGSVKAFRFESPVSKISLPLSQFRKARVTIHWPSSSSPIEWDQAGLLFIRPHPELPEPTLLNAGNKDTAPSFVKVGLEAVGGSLVCNSSSFERGGRAEWSLWPLPKTFNLDRKASFEIVRHGSILLCYLLENNCTSKSMMRTVSWSFDDIKPGEPDMWIGFYVSHPDLKKESGNALEVKFSDFEVETDEGLVKI